MKNNKCSPDVTVNDLWLFILCTFRYAIGRSSYIVQEFIDMYDTYNVWLTDRQKKQIYREIRQEIERHEERGEVLGDGYNHISWKAFCKKLEKAIEIGEIK